MPSQSASDWVTYADYVVIVRPTAERYNQPTKTEVSRGEGSVLRNLTMTVERALWSSSDASRPAPESSFSYLAYGYAFTDGNLDDHVPMVAEGEPRLELGHTYIMALSWEDARCTDGDYVPGGWRGLGSGGMLPFDDAVIGNGEFESRKVDPPEYVAGFPSEPSDLGPSLAGKSAESLVAALHAAKSEPKGDFLPPPAPCT